MNRRTILIVAAIFVVIAAGLLAYFLFFKGGGEEAGLPPGGIPPFGETPGEIPSGTPPEEPGTSPPGAELPISPEQKFSLAANVPVHDFFVDQKNEITVIQPDGQVVQSGIGGNASVLNPVLIANLSKASFSPDGKKIVASFGDTASPQLSLFDVPSKTWKPLDSKIQNPAWGPKGSEMIYFVARNEQSVLESLNVADSKAKPKEFLKLRAQDLVPQWVNTNQIFLGEKASASFKSSLWKFDIRSASLTLIAKDLSGLESVWNSPGTRAVIASVGSPTGRGSLLQLIDGQGKVLYQLKFGTLASKCVFSGTIPQGGGKFSAGDRIQTTLNLKVRQTPSAAGTLLGTQAPKTAGTIVEGPTAAGDYTWWKIDYDKGPDGWSAEEWLEYADDGASAKPLANSKDFLYCAIPRDAEKLSRSFLPDDYYKMTLLTADDFYRIDLINGNAAPILADPGQTIDASNLKIFNNKLFFVNRYDQKLYAITLPE